MFAVPMSVFTTALDFFVYHRFLYTVCQFIVLDHITLLFVTRY